MAINHRVYGCATHKDRADAVCDSRLLVPKDIMETRIIGTLPEKLLAPPALSEMHRTVKQTIKAQQPQTQKRRIGQLE